MATSGNPKFFLGTDTAPHLIHDKESDCGCAGIFNSTYCIPVIAQIFDNENSLDKMENFISKNGANHYKLDFNKDKISIYKSDKALQFKENLDVGINTIKIFNPGFPVYWMVSN